MERMNPVDVRWSRTTVTRVARAALLIATAWASACTTVTRCAVGYERQGSACVDLDECALGTDTCDVQALCTNGPGSYTCACRSGFDGDGRQCTDRDECSPVNPCGAGVACVNTPGSYTCIACSNPCPSNSTCTGIDTCTCNVGFQGNPPGVPCVDVDECTAATNPCGSNSVCLNTPGDYTCMCAPGYELGAGGACVASDAGVCSAPTLGAVSQVRTCADGRLHLTVAGTALDTSTLVAITDGTTPIVGTIASATATSLDAVFDPSPVAGVYRLYVEANGCRSALPGPTVTVDGIARGAVGLLGDGATVKAGIATSLVLFATTATGTLPTTAATAVRTGTSGPTYPLTLTSTATPDRYDLVVPASLGAGTYDVRIDDGTGCVMPLATPLTVTDDDSLGIQRIVPATASSTRATTITAQLATSSTATFSGFPHAYVRPSGNAAAVATPVQAVRVLGPDRLAVEIPATTPLGTYDLVLVGDDGVAALYQLAVTVLASTLPTVANVEPGTLFEGIPNPITITGRDFRAGATVRASCFAYGGGAPEVTVNASVSPAVTVSCAGTGACTLTASFDGTALSGQTACVLTVRNADGATASSAVIPIFSVAGPRAMPVAGPSLLRARRAPAAVTTANASGGRFLYVLGGDDGNDAAPVFDATVEFATVDARGVVGPFVVDADSPLAVPRSFAAAVGVGEYLYVVGGQTTSGATGSVERAKILDPSEVPTLRVVSMTAATTGGLAAGTYTYRVSAVLDAADPINPDGETLASTDLVVRVPALPGGKRVNVTFAITPARQRDGQALGNVSGYRVYRTPGPVLAPGATELLATRLPGQLSYVDTGTATTGGTSPAVEGSVGRFVEVAAVLARKAPSVVASPFSSGAADGVNVHVLMGAATSGSALTSYETLKISTDAYGGQALPVVQLGAAGFGTGRSEGGVFGPVSFAGSTNRLVFVGGGRSSTGTAIGVTESCAIGALPAWSDSLATPDGRPTDMTPAMAGYATGYVARYLMYVGGLQGTTPSAVVREARLTLPAGYPDYTVTAWNDNGTRLLVPRARMGYAQVGPYLYLCGGTTDVTAASATTEVVVMQ